MVGLPKPLYVDEEFKEVRDYPGYCVSNYGRVFSRRSRGTGRLMPYWIQLKQAVASNGYRSIQLQRDKEGVTNFVHVLVLETFMCARPSELEACHNDGDKSNNRLSNLRWDTPANNAKDKHRHGTATRPYMFGENQARAKLTEADVKQIRFKAFLGTSKYVLAREFNVSYRAICHVVNGTSWSHIEG